MTGEANIWNPRTLLEVSADTKRAVQRITAVAGQTLFNITDFAYVIKTGSLEVYRQNSDLTKTGVRALIIGTDFIEQTDTSFALTTPAVAGEQIYAVGYVAITGNVDVRDTDIFVANYQAIRDYVGTETSLYAQGKTTIADEGEDFFSNVTGDAPGTHVDNDDNIIVPTGGDGSAAWLRKSVPKIAIRSLNSGVITDALSCIPRCVAGVFELLDDVGHTPVGVASIQQNGLHQFQINYDEAYTKVNSLLVAVDNNLAPHGVFVGASVGTTLSTINAYINLNGLLTKSGAAGTWAGTDLIDPLSAVNITYVDDILSVFHDGIITNDVPVVSVNLNTGKSHRIGVGYGSTAITIVSIVDLAGLIRFFGGAFEFFAGIDSGISAFDLANITLSESGGVLTVTHPATEDYDIQVSTQTPTSTPAPYFTVVGSVTTTTFDVLFFDRVTGAQIVVADTDMKVFIRRRHSLRGKIPDGAQYLVRGGMVPVRSDRFSQVSGNNFWVTGLLEK